MKKRICLMLTCVLLVVSLVGCGSKGNSASDNSDKKSETTTLKGSSDEKYYMCVPISGV